MNSAYDYCKGEGKQKGMSPKFFTDTLCDIDIKLKLPFVCSQLSDLDF